MDFTTPKDVNVVINNIHERFPLAPIYLVGYSMGTIQGMNWLGKYSNDPACPIKGFVSISNPVDLVKASPLLSQNRIFAKQMTKSLVRLAENSLELLQDRSSLDINFGTDI